jgi:hypothetical protein
MSLKYLEDWLLCMQGTLDINGTTSKKWMPEGPIKLATYDITFINSAAPLISRGVGLTDKQVVLAVKIVTKYQRQWQQLGVDPSYLLTDDIPLRLTTREIDRTTSAKINDKQVTLKFPYNQKLINDLHRLSDNSCGDWRYHKDNKEWTVDLNEGNVQLLSQILHPVDRINDIPWDMDPQLQHLVAEARHCTVSGAHLPKMSLVDGKLVLENVSPYAVDSLVSLGWKEDASNILFWALVAKHHAITLDQSIAAAFTSESHLGTLMTQIMTRLGEFNGKNSMGWPALRKAMTQLPDLNFCFYYRQHNMNKVIDLVNGMPNNMLFMLDYRRKEHITLEDQIDPKNTIFVTDVMIGRNLIIEDLTHKCLGVLYMIPDDEKIDA